MLEMRRFSIDMDADTRRSSKRIALDMVDGEGVARKLVSTAGGFIGGIAFVVDAK